MEKKGQELSIGTLVLIVLGVIVLVLLVLGFSMGWDNLFSKIGIYSGSDISSMVAACKVAVSTQSKASYCEFKSVRIDKEKKEINCEFIEDNNLDERLDCPKSITDLYEQGPTKGLKAKKAETRSNTETPSGGSAAPPVENPNP